jgi:branched-chain amino acid transport system substrate-binding protein
MRTLLALVLPGACRDAQVPLVGYPAPWVGRAVGRVAQARIDETGAPRYVVIPDSLLTQRVPPPRYAGDIAFAESMVALPGVVGMVGPQSSRSTLLVAPIYAEAGIPLVAATATSSRIHALTPRVFQLAPDEDAEGEFLVRFAVDRLGARRVTIFYLVADEYGFGLRQALRASLRKRGLDPVDEVGFLADADVRRRVDESLRRATPDAVIVAARIPETAKLARRMSERRPDVPVLVGDGAPMNQKLLGRLGATTPRLYGATWWHASLPDSTSRAFATRFERETGRTPSASDAVIYDGIMLLAEAVREAGPRRSSVRRWLESLGDRRPPYRGVTGPISFRPDRPVNLVMTQLQDGVVTIVDDRTRDR